MARSRCLRFALAGVMTLLAAPAWADDDAAAAAAAERSVCLAKHMEAQVSRRAGRLLDARESLLVCSHLACPAAIRTDCGDWLQDVSQLTPSIVLSARTRSGDVAAVRVSLDGRPLTERLDGKAIDVDPGEHVFRFELAPYDPVEQKIIVRESEKGRIVSAQLGPMAALEPLDTPAPVIPPVVPAVLVRPVPWTVFALGGAALAGTTMFIAFGASGSSARSSLIESCAPFCTTDEVQSVRTKFLIADISLGVAVAAAAASVVVYALRPSVKRPDTPGHEAPSLAITPGPSSLRLDLRATF